MPPQITCAAHTTTGARRELLAFMVQGVINRGRHTDHLSGYYSIRTNQCPPPPSAYFLRARCPSCCPTNSVKALKATCASDIPGKTGKHENIHLSLKCCISRECCCSWTVLHTYCYLAKRKIVICAVFDNIWYIC